MIRKIALGGALIGCMALASAAQASLSVLIVNQEIISPDRSNLIGLKDGVVTLAAEAQLNACVVAFLDGKSALLKAQETLNVLNETFQNLQRDTCADEAVLPTGEKYCRKYGPPANLIAHLIQLKSRDTSRPLQIFCLGSAESLGKGSRLLEQSVTPLITAVEI